MELNTEACAVSVSQSAWACRGHGLRSARLVGRWPYSGVYSSRRRAFAMGAVPQARDWRFLDTEHLSSTQKAGYIGARPKTLTDFSCNAPPVHTCNAPPVRTFGSNPEHRSPSDLRQLHTRDQTERGIWCEVRGPGSASNGQSILGSTRSGDPPHTRGSGQSGILLF
jgi:hypothetical protein